jgi:hypothetical protein
MEVRMRRRAKTRRKQKNRGRKGGKERGAKWLQGEGKKEKKPGKI